YDTLHEYEANTASPALGPDGGVYVPTADGIVALDGADGSIRWTVDGMTDVAAAAVVDETVYALGAGALHALSRSGEERWTRAVPRGATPTPPAGGESTVIAVTERGVRGYDATSGDERWSVDRRARSYPVLGEGTCYVGSDVGLHALDAATGEERWTFSRGDYRALLTPVLTEDTIYVVEQPGEAGAASFALERTGSKPEPRWCSYIGSGAVTAATAGHVLANLSIGEGPDAAQGIVAFTKDFGRVQWAIEGGSRPRNWVTPPAVVGGTVVLTTRGGTVVTVGGSADA
ncbi:MAG: PQQ-binding-like beta-propeller repeat protein, partial [Halodesulfurarchaeum sp.]